MRKVIALIILVTCLTLKDVKDAECQTACRRDGAKDGEYSEKRQACVCMNFFDYNKMTRKVEVKNRLEKNNPPSIWDED